MYGAMIGTLLGSVGALLTPAQRKELVSKMSDKTKNWSDNLLDMKNWMQPKKESQAQNFFTGMLCGLFLGQGQPCCLHPNPVSSYAKT